MKLQYSSTINCWARVSFVDSEKLMEGNAVMKQVFEHVMLLAMLEPANEDVFV